MRAMKFFSVNDFGEIGSGTEKEQAKEVAPVLGRTRQVTDFSVKD